MDNYAEVLKYLIELKKTKKEPNKLERDQFTEAWTALLRNEGYSALAEEYLYRGFTYCGAVPLKNYIKNNDDRVAALNAVFAGKMYGENCANTVPVLFHLLTLFLNDKNTDNALISLLIRRIPSALKNKEGKIYGQADRALKKYILDDLHTDILPPFGELIDNGLNAIFVKEFVVAFDAIIADMKSDGFSKKCTKNIKLLQEWMHPAIEESPELKNTEPSENADDANTLEKSEVIAIVSEPLEKHLLELKLKETCKQLDAISAELRSQKLLVSGLKQQLSDASGEKNRLNELLLSNEKKITTLSAELFSAKTAVEKQEKRIAQMEQEIQERMKLTEALSRDRAKQSDEAFNRLASRLRIEYRDFMDAVDIPMNRDLGENMREQLKNVFDILIKAGIAIN